MSALEAPQRRSPPICIGTSVRASVSSDSRALSDLRYGSPGAYARTGSLTGKGTLKCPSAVIISPGEPPSPLRGGLGKSGYSDQIVTPPRISQGPRPPPVGGAFLIGSLSTRSSAALDRIRQTVACSDGAAMP